MRPILIYPSSIDRPDQQAPPIWRYTLFHCKIIESTVRRKHMEIQAAVGRPETQAADAVIVSAFEGGSAGGRSRGAGYGAGRRAGRTGQRRRLQRQSQPGGGADPREVISAKRVMLVGLGKGGRVHGGCSPARGSGGPAQGARTESELRGQHAVWHPFASRNGGTGHHRRRAVRTVHVPRAKERRSHTGSAGEARCAGRTGPVQRGS